MPLPQIQFNEALRDALLAELKSGKVPSLSAVTNSTNDRLPEEQGAPTFMPRRQEFRAQWDLNGMNAMMNEADFDLRVMYKALVALVTRTLRRLNMVEISSRAQHAQMDRIESLALNLLFVVQDGDGHFTGFQDDFHDYSRIDLSASTRGMVDLASQTAELPENFPTSKKISLNHLTPIRGWPVVVNANSTVVSANTPRDAPFRDMFLDTVNMWRHDVITEEPGPVSVSFTFPVHHVRGGEITITRVQVIGVSQAAQQADIEYSVDGVNFLRFPNTPSTVELEKSSRAVNLDFPATRVEFIKITLYRETNDKLTDSGHLTSFGLRHVSLYTLGRTFEAELVSLPFEVEDDERIEKVSVSVFEEIPSGTNIKYFIGPVVKEEADEQEPEFTGQWVPITPLTRAKTKDEAPRIVRMSSLSKKELTFVPESPMDPTEKYKGVNYYQLNGTTAEYADKLITEKVVYRSAALFRGRSAWLRKKSDKVSLFNVTDAFVSFSTGPRQKLFTTATEIVNFDSVLRWDDQPRSTLVVSRPIDFRPNDGMSLVAPEGVDPATVPDPLHAMYEVALSIPSDEVSESLIMPAAPGKVQFGNAPIEIGEKQETVERLSAYRPNLGTHDEALIAELESRGSLNYLAGLTIKNMVSISTPADVEAGKPQLTRFTIGNDDGAGVPIEFTVDGEVISSAGTPAPTDRTLSGLTDEQLLELFGKVTFRTTLQSGITATNAAATAQNPTPGTATYLPGEDFDLHVIPNAATGVPALFASITPTSQITALDQVTFTYRYKQDLTRHVLSVQGSRIYLDANFSQSLPAGTKVKVTYRFVPVGVNEVLKDSLRVVLEPGSDVEFISGRDYHFSPSDGSITLIPSGNIKGSDGKLAVYASFTHKGALNALETYSTWVWVDSRDAIRLHYPRLEVDTGFGERVLVGTNQGAFVDISNTTESPELGFGWHQVLVQSRDPDIFAGTAIRKVAELRDLDEQPVFLAGGDYFTKMEGTRIPMTQVPVDFLRNSVLPSDHSKFAIDEAGRVIVNFQPNTQQDYYTYGYRTNSAGVDVNQYYNEEFLLKYDYHRDEARTVSGLVFRVVLSRERSSDGGVTPKLKGYQLRIG